VTTSGRSWRWSARWPVLLCAAALCGLAGDVLALSPGTESSHYGHDVWDSDSGLPQNSVQAILQSRDGYFWLGTQEGLVRFDGVRFTVFDGRNTPALKDDWVQTLCETRDGSLWIGTVTGLARRRNGRFEEWGAGTDLERAPISSLLETRDGTLWIGSGVGLARVRDGKLTILSQQNGFPRDRVRSLYEDARGNLWFGLPNALACLHDGELELHLVRDGFPAAPLSITGDGEGGLWIGTSRGLVRFREGSTRLYGQSEGLSSRPVDGEGDGLSQTLPGALYRDRQGTLWIGTGGGLFRFRDGAFTRYTTANGLSSNRVLSIYEDHEGSLWIGTTDGGLNRFKSQRVVNYTRREGLSDDKIWTVFEDRGGTLWVGGADGSVDRLRPGESTFERYTQLGNIALSMDQDTSGDLWIGTQGAGLVRLHEGRMKRYTFAEGLPGNWIITLCADRRGGIWIGTVASGVAFFKDGKFRAYHVRDGLPSEQIFSIYQDREGDVWFGTFGGGVARLHDGVFQTFTTRDGLAHDIVISIYQGADGTHWFSTRGGLSSFRDGKFTTYRQNEGLMYDAVQRVLEDGRGSLWLTSNRGIFRVGLSELAAAADGGPRIHPVAINTANGMRGAECNNAQHGAFRSRDGRLWFATVKGLAMADPTRIELNRVPPAVVIEEVLTAGETVETAGAGVELAPGKNDLEFRYTAFNYANPTAVRFRYRLEGSDAQWVEAGARRTAYYTHLPPGRYRFSVMACNEDGVWNKTGATLPVRLDPRFYQTAWFLSLAILGVFLAGFAGHRLRVRQIEAREWFRSALAEAKLNALQAQLRPHFLANTLNSILALIGKDSSRARRMVERLGDLLRASLETDPGQIVTLERELSILELYLGIERMRFRDRLDVVFEVDPAVRYADVASFLLQPLVENAIKHGMHGRAGRGVIRIRAVHEGERLVLQIEDNGPGIPSTGGARQSGIGVRNTRQRLETLYPGRHVFELGNSPAGGCRVTIEIPFTEEAAKADEPARVVTVASRLRPVPADDVVALEPETDQEPARRLSDA
jgi:ligand-binding sensor domain-containing protein